MRRLALMLVCLVVCAGLVGCGRKVVVDRNFGRVDGARSISTNSDPQWTIQREPAAAGATQSR